MLNVIWVFMMVTAIIVGIFTGKLPAVILAASDSAKFAFNLAIGLTGVMALWLGIMKIAEAAGLLNLFTKMLRPILIRLFPDVPADHPAMGAMTMNIAANMFGLNNAATPFGLRAMTELEKLNKIPGTATNAMCTFITLHSSNLQIIPVSAIALLAASGSTHPTDIVVPFLLSSLCAVITAIVVAKLMERLPKFRYPSLPQEEGAAS